MEKENMLQQKLQTFKKVDYNRRIKNIRKRKKFAVLQFFFYIQRNIKRMVEEYTYDF